MRRLERRGRSGDHDHAGDAGQEPATVDDGLAHLGRARGRLRLPGRGRRGRGVRAWRAATAGRTCRSRRAPTPRQAKIASPVESCGSVTIAHSPTSPNAAKPSGATIHRLPGGQAEHGAEQDRRDDDAGHERRLVVGAEQCRRRTASATRRSGRRTRPRPRSPVTSPSRTAAAASSPAASAAPAARAPVRAAAARPGTEGGVVRCRSRRLLGEQHAHHDRNRLSAMFNRPAKQIAKLRAPSPSARAPATYAPGVAPTAGPMVLVVDDEPMVREVVARYLEHDGMRVHELGDGDAAVAVVGRARGRPRGARRDAARRRRAVAAAPASAPPATRR